jgi:class 3 adenylate cyclase
MPATPDSTLADVRRSNADLQRELAEVRRTLDERTHERDEALHERDEVLRERDEALQRETATAEVLQVINSSPGDLTPIFDAILEKAHAVCDSAHGSLCVLDGELFHAVASRGLPEAMVQVVRQPFRGNAYHWQLVHGERYAHIPDMRVLPSAELDAVGKASRGAGIRTALLVPLRKDGTLVGFISAARHEVRPFSDKQIALLQNFAAQAVIAMENARLITETREALEQQTATAEVLGVINSSPGDLAPVFDAMLERAMRLCEAAFGHLDTYDGNSFHTAAIRGVPAAYAEYRRNNPPIYGPGTGPARMLAGERIVHHLDMMEEEAYRRGEPNRRALVDLGGARSAINMALVKEGTFLGFITLFRREVRPFTDKQIALVENFAAQAVIAIENARLITETREALDQQTATAEVLGVINSSPGDLTPVFDAILEKAHTLCGASKGSLVIIDGEQFRTAATRGLSEPYAAILREAQHNPPGSVPDRLLKGEDLVHIADASQSDFPVPRAAAELEGARTIVYVPLRKDSTLIGYITAYRQEVRPFTDKQIALLQNFAAQAVVAMENARLLTETREALEQQIATAEVLQVINSSPGDLAPVFEVILEKAHGLCGATYGSLQTYSGEHIQAVAMRGAPPQFAEVMRQPFKPDLQGQGPVALLISGAPYVQIADLPERLAQGQDDIRTRAAVELGGLRTVLFVPLRKDGVLLGYISAWRQEVRPFADKEITLLQNFAAQAVIAMENARLLGELRERNDEIAGWNRELEARVEIQLAELERTGKLRRFLAPQLADLIIAQGDESILESHRREIVVVFCDIRGFTAFAERAEPEEVMALLRDYHAALGPIVARFEGTLDHYSGDGVMVFFNDPLPTPEPAKRAIEMATAMREAAQQVLKTWRRHGHDLGFGVGISQGYATLGQIGFAERMDYTAIGTVCNLAARLCDEAKDGQILISRRVAVAVEEDAKLEEMGEVALKGLSQAVAVYNVVQ